MQAWNAQIVEITKNIEQLHKKRKKLISEKEQQDIKQLLEATKESEMTPEELVTKFKAANEADTPKHVGE